MSGPPGYIYNGCAYFFDISLALPEDLKVEAVNWV